MIDPSGVFGDIPADCLKSLTVRLFEPVSQVPVFLKLGMITASVLPQDVLDRAVLTVLPRSRNSECVNGHPFKNVARCDFFKLRPGNPDNLRRIECLSEARAGAFKSGLFPLGRISKFASPGDIKRPALRFGLHNFLSA